MFAWVAHIGGASCTACTACALAKKTVFPPSCCVTELKWRGHEQALGAELQAGALGSAGQGPSMEAVQAAIERACTDFEVGMSVLSYALTLIRREQLYSSRGASTL